MQQLGQQGAPSPHCGLLCGRGWSQLLLEPVLQQSLCEGVHVPFPEGCFQESLEPGSCADNSKQHLFQMTPHWRF